MLLRENVIAGAVGGFAGPGQSGSIGGIEAENFLELVQRAGVVSSPLEKPRGLEMAAEVLWQCSGQGNEFGIGLGAGVFLKQEFNELDAGAVAVGIWFGGPNSIHGIVVVTGGVFDATATGSDAGESEIDSGVLGCALPESEHIGFRFVETILIIAIA